MNDAREMHVAGAVPSGSLLVWIDEMLEHPDTLLDRTVGQWSNMRGGRRHFSAEARQWMQLKVLDRAWHDTPLRAPPDPAGPADDRLVVRDHGGFNDVGVPFWERSFWSTESGLPCAIPIRFSNEPPPVDRGCTP